MSVDTNNAEFQDALNLIQYTRQSVFLTGKAGTGKSTFLRYVCEHTKKKHVVLAPTGIAAINAGGSTMHSFFKLPFYPLLPDDPNLSLQRGRIHEFFKYTKPHRKLLEQIELVIIDEISMVRADIIDLCQSVQTNRPGLYRTSKSISTDRPCIRQCPRPYPHQYSRSCRPATTQHPLRKPD